MNNPPRMMFAQTMLASYIAELVCNQHDESCIATVTSYISLLELVAVISVLIGKSNSSVFYKYILKTISSSGRLLILQALWEIVGGVDNEEEEEEGENQAFPFMNGDVPRAEDEGLGEEVDEEEEEEEVRENVVPVIEVTDYDEEQQQEVNQEYSREFGDVLEIVAEKKEEKEVVVAEHNKKNN